MSESFDRADEAATRDFDETSVDGSVVACSPTAPPGARPGPHWIEVEMVGEDDEPMVGARYRLELDDGRVLEGTLGKEGIVRVEGLSATVCGIAFPGLDDEAWQPLS